jgi:DNA-binding NarL/FixJ family response regulator
MLRPENELDMKKVNKNPKVHVAVLTDDPLRMIGLRSLLKSERDISVECLNVADGSSALIDVVLIRVKGNDFETQVDKIKIHSPRVRIIAMGPSLDESLVTRSLTLGARGYISETASVDEIANAIRTVNQGLVWAPRRIIGGLIETLTRSPERCRHGREALTEREKEVLKLLVEGRSNKEIASPLEIEERTVKSHVSRMMRKLQVTNRIALSLLAVRESIIATP